MELKKILSQLPPTCRIVAVSKTQTTDKIRLLYKQGQQLFAENYVQEAIPKIKELKDLSIEWHFIGRIQKNKLKFIVGQFHLIHSVDSLSIVEQMEKICSQQGLTQSYLIQVNLAQEKTKGGLPSEEILNFLSEAQKYSHTKAIGLMTMPPLSDNPENNRKYFQQLKNLQKKLFRQFPSLTELSMGTSSDFIVAAAEGASLVRIGTLLFGERKK